MNERSPKNCKLNLVKVTGVSKDKTVAQAALSATVGNASAIVNWGKSRLGEISLNDCIGLLNEEAERVSSGHLGDMEATLVSQVRTLDTIFTVLAVRAAKSENVDLSERYLRLALKAQGQVRTTVEALKEMKCPRSALFIGQQYNAEQQQVNNSLGTVDGTIPKYKNELLEAHDGKWLDSRTAATSSRANSPLATVGTINRTNNKKGTRS
jgi:hypothetical protein